MFVQTTSQGYRDGRCAGLVARSHQAQGVAAPFGRRHTTLAEAIQFASEAKFPVVNLNPGEKRSDRAFWLGYVRALRNGS